MEQKHLEIPDDFKVTLPPRKRARTKEEKEQRRIERILRNRKAAHHSREKKRMHLQLLEHKCDVMERLLACIGNLDDVVLDEGRELLQEYRSMTSDGEKEEAVPNGQASGCGSGAEDGQSPPQTALTPVSFVNDEEKADQGWDLLLTKSQQLSEPVPVFDESTLAPPLLWLAGNEESSFEFDDWRNPAVITAFTALALR
ncbi:hypothetical protein HG536_0B06660 [Torulaspora globosa]|uniref:BZIP domain-containing protein n=1 Tax=Torulaspora globosa TaxID=48254 RepID=A0A7G3ZE62_9SACH|nr:uncharacterized protein HG536_0B06660 [Torulaspora globosa]QLL31798.1 hypothetical protein HG536_0B06660 [Torulaspora globosa]